MNQKHDLRSLSLQEIEDILQENGIEKYRASQIWNWLYRHADSFEEMTNIPRSLREQLHSLFHLTGLTLVERLDSQLDSTKKYIFRLDDGEYIESVLLEYNHGFSVCLSSQAGCKMGCTFCASSKAGFSRNLKPSEMLLQLELITRDRRKENQEFRIGHIVMMGIGEPLDNYNNVMKFLRLVNDKKGFNIGYRNISLSTCGLVPMIDRLAKEDIPLTLSVSLHAPNNSIRSQTMPVNKTYPVEALIEACRRYAKQTGRRISFEYAMIRGVNDSVEHAKELGELLRGILCHVNLINVNETRDNNCKKTSKENQKLFTNQLNKCKINVTVRRTMGADIQAACGQLRRDRLESKSV